MAFDFLYDAMMMVLAFAGVIAGWEQVRTAHKKNDDFLHMKKKKRKGLASIKEKEVQAHIKKTSYPYFLDALGKEKIKTKICVNAQIKKNVFAFNSLNLNELNLVLKKLFNPDILGGFDLEKKVTVILFVEKKRCFAF